MVASDEQVADQDRKFEPHEFRFFVGERGECSLYVNPKVYKIFVEDYTQEWGTIDDVEWALKSDTLSLQLLNKFLEDGARVGYFKDSLGDDASVRSIKTFSTITEVYSELSDATMSLRAIYEPLNGLKWVEDAILAEPHYQYSDYSSHLRPSSFLRHAQLSAFDLTRRTKFAFLVYMETGNANISPQNFEPVVAMCTEDSIFVSACLLLDPSETETVSEGRIRRLRGNIGKPGIAMLTAPADPLTKAPELASWKVISHRPFHGELSDKFKGTSLQLGFTNFKLPINTSNLSVYDMGVMFLEAVIHVNDRNGS